MSPQETDAHAPEGVAANPPKRGPLLIMTAGACLVGAVIVLGAVLPAEFNKDPLGLGKATGLSRLWAPPEETVVLPPSVRVARDPVHPANDSLPHATVP